MIMVCAIFKFIDCGCIGQAILSGLADYAILLSVVLVLFQEEMGSVIPRIQRVAE